MRKVLIANRAEIACRIFQSCREMGLKAVGIVAPGDEDARHVTYAEEIQSVPGYLDIASIVGAAKKSGATLVHPGYGFLSERPAFARAVEEAGLVFVGPRAETMELMGGKIAAKETAVKLGVPTLPWARVSAGQDLSAAAKAVGFPLLLKASAGGGGKGMRRVNQPSELEAASESAMAEAQSAFGDPTLFLERLVERPRHIEVQVFGDGKGEATHLYERDCSLQRRHQKIWEEAPAPHLNRETREGLFTAALKLAKAVKYRSAGTVEFLVDEQGAFYFLEMNTRLQVEHPVTENITGLDLVWAQLAQALAPDSTVLRDAPDPRGHSIEVRLYAENPYAGFCPTPGKIERLKWPSGPGIRVDSGIEEGQTIGTQFDSMLAKLIVHAPTRDHALARMRYALSETQILGVGGFGTNQGYLQALAEHPQVCGGHGHTGLLSEELGSCSPVPGHEELEVILAIASSSSTSDPSADWKSPWVS